MIVKMNSIESILKEFKPNLIPNNLKSEVTDFDKIILKNGGYSKYCILKKKDGCRVELIDGEVLTRALKSPGSQLVIDRFKPIAEEFKKLNILVEGEFYMHGLKFNSIFRFFSKENVESPKYRLELEKALKKDPEKFLKEYETTNINFLTEFHTDLKLHIFDCIILDRPDLTGFFERIYEMIRRVMSSHLYESTSIVLPILEEIHSKEHLETVYQKSLEEGYEGLVLVHQNHEYKFGRNSLNQGTLLKMKEDSLEYDGIIVDVLEGTSVKDGVETTVDNLGYSETSKKKDDRELSGLAKGFLTAYYNESGDYVGEFIVGLNGFDNTQKRYLLENKDQFIGRDFKYTGMKPVKDFPRHAFFQEWRDEK
jgi:hypothetical protein